MEPEVVLDRSEEDRFSVALDRRAADRAWKKRRRVLLLGMALLVALLVANVVLALTVTNLRGELGDVKEAVASDGAASHGSGTSVSAEEVAALQARFEELEQAYAEITDASPGGGSAGSVAADTARLRREVNRTMVHVRCTDRALRRLDASLRRLLTRDLDPNLYVAGRPLLECP